MSARASTPRRLSAPQRREQLLDVTKAIVDERGFHAVSIDAVAREAGISRPIVYEHFGTLPGLLEALVERELARALTQLAAILPGDLAEGDPREILLAAQRAYLDAARADPATWRLVLMPPEGAPAMLREQIAAGRTAVVGYLTNAVRTGLFRDPPPDPELAAHLLATSSDEAVRLMLADPERYPPERLLAFSAWFLDQVVSR
jgi:AcrR family transcriptional regulator